MSRDWTEDGMRGPRVGRVLLANAIDQGVKRRDVLVPLTRSRREHLRRRTDPRLWLREPVDQQASALPEPEQSRAYLHFAVAEPQPEPPRPCLDVANRDA